MDKKLKNEIEHGKYLSHRAEEIWGWGTLAGKKRATRRANYFVELGRIAENSKVLEIGCGTALFTEKVFSITNADIVAIDISEDLLNQARLKLPNVKFAIEDAMNLSFDDNSFDCVYGSSIIHHLDFKKSLQEIYRVLKPGGRMVFAEPNMINPQIFLQKNIPYIKKKMGDSPDETAVIRWSFAALMKKQGFDKIRIFPYDFLHPATPIRAINFVNRVGIVIENVPILREIAGSVVIFGEKSSSE